ncbi:MAG: ATPase [Ruminococcaceae bacterium]|nr:ATPase [Oscillospiraceae bacterium]
MLEEQKRAQRLGTIIVEDAKHIASEIIENAKKEYEEIIQRAQEKYKHDEEEDILQDKHDTSIIYAKEISHRDYEARKQVLSYRNQKVNELFTKISVRIGEYTDSEKYTEKLKALLEKANTQMPFYEGCVISHSAKDEAKIKKAVDGYTAATTAVDKTILLGGISVYYPKENIYLDLTFDSALDAERKSFAKHSELSL